METFELTRPAHWASAVMNGDFSGIENESEETEIKEWLEELAAENLEVIDVSEESHYGRHNGLLTELATYTAMVVGVANCNGAAS